MADKMMRVAGRGNDGTAKSFNVDDNGNLKTLQSRYRVVRQAKEEPFTISAGQTWTSSLMDVSDISDLVLSTQFSQSVLHRITIKEYILSDELIKEINSFQARNEAKAVSMYGNQELEIPISETANRITVSIQNAGSTTLTGSFLAYGTNGLGLTYYDEENYLFKRQQEIATEKTLKNVATEETLRDLVNTLRNNQGQNNSPETTHHEKPLLKNVEVVENTDGDQILWFHDGLFYANLRSNRRTIVTSSDGREWTPLHTFPVNINKILVGDLGHIMAGAVGGEVYVSDENGEFSDSPTFTTGRLSHMFGRFKHENILGFTTYHTPGGMDDGQKHEAWLSVDNGKTYEKVFDNSTLTELLEQGGSYSDSRVHLHDIEYDPYSGRLFIWQGDFDSVTLYFSDDWGENWGVAFPRGESGNHTQLIAVKSGLAIGADNPSGGVGFLHLNRKFQTQPTISYDDFDKNHWNFKLSEGENYVAGGKFVDRENNFYLLPYEVEHDTNGVRNGLVAYSRDGENWGVLWESPIKGAHTGIETIFYGNGLLIGLFKDNTLHYKTLIAEVSFD